jgi:hypothetical protein
MTLNNLNRALLLVVAAFSWSFAPNVFADTQIQVVPTAWRLQSYGGNTVLFFTGSPCTYGRLDVPTTWSVDQSKLLLATVMAAKASRIPMFVYYVTDTSGNCTITSFGLDSQ